MSDDLMNEIAAAKDKSSIIMVVGVGGAGGNAVNHMWNLGIKDVGFMVCNTDAQALDNSPVEEKVQLGREGLGAGNDPENGRKAAIESLDDIRRRLEAAGTRMLFVTAGMGGGTGTGASPVIAKLAHEMGILTVGIVTSPLAVEGKIRYEQAFRGIEELSRNVDSLLVINNENIVEMYGRLSLKMCIRDRPRTEDAARPQHRGAGRARRGGTDRRRNRKNLVRWRYNASISSASAVSA